MSGGGRPSNERERKRGEVRDSRRDGDQNLTRDNQKMTMKCSQCENATECRYTFGAFWSFKSSNGEGCDYPIKPDKFKLAKVIARVEQLKEKAKSVELVQGEIDF